MSETAIRAAIKSLLSGVSGIGVVHDRRRYGDTWDAWFTAMTSSGKINGWTINRESTPAEYDSVSTIRRLHSYAITGFYEVDDDSASETTFQALLDAIFTAFAGSWTLSGTAMISDPIQIEFVGIDLFGDELVNRLLHTARLSLTVEERAFLT